MAGHSKWKQIKHKKGVADQKRGALFSKLLKAVAIAARDNPDPGANPRLRSTIEKARAANMPSENIERALKRQSEEKDFFEVFIEAYGPEKSAFIIEGITDNTNRTMTEVRILLSSHGAKVASQGSVLWGFTKTESGWQPQYEQAVPPAALEKIRAIKEELEAHEDVQSVTVNIRGL